jgi:hypothetical protein
MQSFFFRKPLRLSLGGRELLAREVHQVHGVGLIENGEIVPDPCITPEAAEESVTSSMKRSAMHLAGNGPDEAFNAREHFLRGAPREGEKEDSLRADAALEEMRDAVNEGAGLAGSCAGDDQECAVAVRCGRLLLLIQSASRASATRDVAIARGIDVEVAGHTRIYSEACQ